MGRPKSKVAKDPEISVSVSTDTEKAEVSRFVDQLMRTLEAADPDRLLEERAKAAELAGVELDESRARLEEARKTCPTRSGALLQMLGLGRPKRQGGRAGKLKVRAKARRRGGK